MLIAVFCVRTLLYLHTNPDASTDGFSSIIRNEGVQGLFRGTTLALFGVSNGALQFVAYERMKRWGFELKRKQFKLAGRPWTPEVDKLVRNIHLYLGFPADYSSQIRRTHSCLGAAKSLLWESRILTRLFARDYKYVARLHFLYSSDRIFAEQRHNSLVSHHPRYYSKNVGPRGRPGVLSRSRYESSPGPSWHLRDVRCV